MESSSTHNCKGRNGPFAGNVAEEAGHILERLEHADIILLRGRQSRRRRCHGFLHKLSRSCCDRTVCEIGLGRLGDDAASRPHYIAERTGLDKETRQGHEQICRRREERAAVARGCRSLHCDSLRISEDRGKGMSVRGLAGDLPATQLGHLWTRTRKSHHEFCGDKCTKRARLSCLLSRVTSRHLAPGARTNRAPMR
jgi:hypothetical protein